MSKKGGLFVTIEGPNGSGKSTIIDMVANRLAQYGHDILKTKEPTLSLLGDFVRNAEELYRGLILAFLVAADRQFHVEYEILPAVKKGRIVLSDRYIESSLVLQRLDGLEIEDIWSLNSSFLVPDLSIVFVASIETLGQRLERRSGHSHFEKTKSREEELRFYLEAVDFLKEQGFNIWIVENDITPPMQNAEKIAQRIISLIPH